jgi:hypothetical protein
MAYDYRAKGADEAMLLIVAARYLQAMEHSSKEDLEEYLHEHPKADPRKHTVRKVPRNTKDREAPKKKRFVAPSKANVSKARREAKNTTWTKPSIDDEMGEIERTAKAFGVDRKKLVEAAKKAKLVDLDDKTWSKLENTDSYDTDSVEKATQLAEEYDRDIASVIKGIGGELPAAIVLMKKGEAPYLIGGNTRLMASRAFGAAPKVLMVHVA